MKHPVTAFLLKHSLTAAFPFLLLHGAQVAHADWMLVDDFEAYTEASYRMGGEHELQYPASSNGGLGIMDIWKAEEVEGVGGEQAAHFWVDPSIPEGGDFWHQIPLPAEIGVDGIGSIYFRVWHENQDLNWHVMLSKSPSDLETIDQSRWADMAAILRYSGDTDSLYAFDGAAPEGQGYFPAAASDGPAAGEWYEYWLIVDNAYEGEVNTGTYSVYRRDPGEAHPRQLQWLDAEGHAVTKLPFRDQSVGAFKTIVLSQFFGFSRWLIDDIYFSEGACLSNPVEGEACESWGKYPLLGGYADTEDWLGWVYAAEAPWVHGPSTGWLYAPITPDASGAWVYLVR